MGTQIDGKKIQQNIIEELRTTIREHKLSPSLAIFSVNKDPRSLQYMNIKKGVGESLGIPVHVFDCNEISQQEIIVSLHKAQEEYSGVLFQMPFSNPENKNLVLGIDSLHDVDFLNKNTHYDFLHNFGPPVALAVKRILYEIGIDITKKNDHVFVVVGRGSLVGLPCLEMLSDFKQEYYVVDETTEESEKKKIIQRATVIISGTGVSGIITPDLLGQNTILLDAGTSPPESLVRGDVDPLCYEKSSFYTPVPGGVGPVAVAMLFQNLVTLLLQKKKDTNDII